MGAREPYKVHSLKKHIADTKSKPKGTPIPRPTSSRMPSGGSSQKGKSGDQLFGDSDDDSDEDTAITDDSSDDQNDFLAKLGGTNGAAKRRPFNDEIADSDDERKAAVEKKKKKKSSSKEIVAKVEPESSDDDRIPKTQVNNTTTTSTSEESTSSEDSSDEESNKNVKKEAGDDKVSETSSESGESSSEKSKSSSSSSSGSDSESDSDESRVDGALPKKAVNGAAKKFAPASSSSSEEDSNDESDSSEESENPEPKSQPKPVSRKVQEAETTSSEEEDEEEDGDASEHKLQKSLPLLTRKDGKQAAVPAILRSSSDNVDIAEICSQARLQGKQLWYFIAPSNAVVSIAHNLEISLDDARHGNGAVSHNGEAYGVSVNALTPKSTIQVVMPSTDTSQYRLASQQPSQIMQLNRLPQLDASSAAVGPSSKPKARAQPAGLNARFKPIGVYDPATKLDPLSQPDTIMEDAPDVPLSSSPKKKKKEKGSKKRKLTPSEEDAEAAAYQLIGESHEAETGSKKPRTGRTGSLDLGLAPRTKTASIQPISIPAKKGKLGSATKEKKVKTPAPSSSQPPVVKQTPVPLPPRQSQVPLPNVPGSSQPSYSKRSPIPIPQPPAYSGVQLNSTPSSKPDKPKKSKSTKSKEGKEKEKRPSLQHSSSSKSETPVIPPVVTGMD